MREFRAGAFRAVTSHASAGCGRKTMKPRLFVTAAALAIDGDVTVQRVSYEKLETRLLKDAQVLRASR